MVGLSITKLRKVYCWVCQRKKIKSVNNWQSHKPDSGCLVHCAPGHQTVKNEENRLKFIRDISPWLQCLPFYGTRCISQTIITLSCSYIITIHHFKRVPHLTSTVVTFQLRTAKVRLINLVCHIGVKLCIRHLFSCSFCCYWNFCVGENWKLLVSLCCPSLFVLSSYKTAFPMFAWHARQQPRRDFIGLFIYFTVLCAITDAYISALPFSSPPKATSALTSEHEYCGGFAGSVVAQ